jgi:NADH-quinone oxidoreductase subunit F
MFHDTAGIAMGAGETLEALRSAVTGLDVDVQVAGALGFSYAEPMLEVARPGGPRVVYAKVTADRVPPLVDAAIRTDGIYDELAFCVTEGSVPGLRRLEDTEYWPLQDRRLMANLGRNDPEDIDHYIATGGYEGLDRALQMTPEEVSKQVLDSGLWGRGGAAFPTGRKWEFLRGARGTPKYQVCNADEGDPGAFVNRVLMEGDPHLVVEGMIIGGYATGAAHGFIYIRDEYPLSVGRMERALQQASEKGLLGINILGSGFDYTLEVIRGAGAYVCGEETGLIASIQDYRGMPRIKPPFPAQAGVFFKPTNVNNVETFANVPLILRHGAEWYASAGTEKNKGTKMFSLSGSIDRVGILEVPFGTSMERLLREAGGWTRDNRALKAIQPGGPLGGILGADAASLALEPEPFREKGVLMGSGGLILFDDRTCIVDMVLYFLGFVEDESCGRCTTCRQGAQRMVEILRRIAHGGGREEDLDLIRLLGNTMRWANCVHGQAGPTAALNAMQYFMPEIETHIRERRCPAGACAGLVRYDVAKPPAPELEAAAAICPTGAFVRIDGGYAIDQAKCIRCGACKEQAPEAIAVSDAFAPVAAGR